MKIKISLAPVVLVWRLVCALLVLGLLATGVGALLLAIYGVFGYDREIVDYQSINGDDSLVTVKWTPRWVAWVFGGCQSEVSYYSDIRGRYVDSAGNTLRASLGNKVQFMECRLIFIRDAAKK